MKKIMSFFFASLSVSAVAVDVKSVKRIIPLHKTIRISLDANKTTGYSWQLVKPSEKIAVIDEGYIPAQAATKMVGTGGSQYWIIQGNKKGTAHLRFEYKRPWEKDKPAVQVQEYIITIR